MEDTYKKRLMEVSTSILQASRNELYLSMRFLDIALNSLPYELYVATLTMGTDGEKLYYNPNYLMNLYRSDPLLVNRAYLHSLLHCMFRHMYMGEDREEDTWNLACDIAVESMIDSMDYHTLKMTIPDEREEMYDKLRKELPVLSAEGIYSYLKKNRLSLEEYLHMAKLFVVDDHSIWEQRKKETGEDGGSQPQEQKQESDQKESEEKEPEDKDGKEKQSQEEKEKSEDNGGDSSNTSSEEPPYYDSGDLERLQDQWQEISEKVGTNLETFSMNIGEGAGDLLKQLRIRNRKRYNYRDFLRKFAVMREEMTVDMDSFDYIYYTYGLTNYNNMPFIEPLEYKEEKKIEEFVIAIDTSGSCQGHLITHFLEETVKILADSATFSKEVIVYIIQCDEQIQEVRKLTSLEDIYEYMKNFEAKGFGGTDFRPVFTYVDQMIANKELEHLKGMIYFTDGFGVFPKKASSYETAFVFVGEEFSEVKVPAWAMKIVLSKEELNE